MKPQFSHAVVCGASMAGLCAARALAGIYERVTVLDRDELPAGGERAGVPQARQTHAVLPRLTVVLEAMFPGLRDELEAVGAPIVRNWDQIAVALNGYRFAAPSRPLEPPAWVVTRATLEAIVRARVRRLPGVRVEAGVAVTGLIGTAGGRRVAGVHLSGDGALGELAADLVVDATGRSGRATGWLGALGYAAVPESRLRVDVRYASRFLALPADAMGRLVITMTGAHAAWPRLAALSRVEGGRWLLTASGYGDAHQPPADDAGFLAFAATALVPEAREALRDAQPAGPIAVHHYPACLRRRYDRATGLPEGFVVIGDAAASFNPLYGQGMTVAALQAQALRACLLRDGHVDPHRFYAGARRPIGIAWTLATTADATIPSVGKGGPTTRAVAAAIGRVSAAAAHDVTVGDTFLRVAGLLDPPTAMLSPAMLGRVLRPRPGTASRGETADLPPPAPTPPAPTPPAPAPPTVPAVAHDHA